MVDFNVSPIVADTDAESVAQVAASVNIADAQILAVQEAILQGYKDWANGAYYQSTGDFFKDREMVARREAEGWK